jgi:hypothetical protein
MRLAARSGERVIPVIILAVPRSGSTLVQRLLAAHPDVSTTGEPWLLFPVVGAAYPELVVGGRWHGLVSTGLEDFAAALPGGWDDMRAVVAEAATELYTRAARPGTRYFVDKSTGYALLADGIMRLLPDARFVFVWRNPLAVVASLSSTWQHGRWRPDDYDADLHVGLPHLADTYARRSGAAVGVRYEDLIRAPEPTWRALTDALGLPPAPDALSSFADFHPRGRLGDPTGQFRYRSLDRRPLDHWRAQLATEPRRRWCRRYLRRLGEDRLAVMGYSLAELLRELDAEPAARRGAARDVLDGHSSAVRAAVRRARQRRGRQRLMASLPAQEG